MSYWFERASSEFYAVRRSFELKFIGMESIIFEQGTCGGKIDWRKMHCRAGDAAVSSSLKSSTGAGE